MNNIDYKNNSQSKLNFEINNLKYNYPFENSDSNQNKNKSLLSIIKKRFLFFIPFSIFLFAFFVVLGYLISNSYNYFEDEDFSVAQPTRPPTAQPTRPPTAQPTYRPTPTQTRPTVTPSTSLCKGASQECQIFNNGSTNCCHGLVCQNGVTGQLRCEQPRIDPNSQCPGGRCGGAGGWLGFNCSRLTNGQCLENPATFNDYASASAYAGNCGQVDEVCVGGTNNRRLCGNFEIFSSSCGRTENNNNNNNNNNNLTPTPTPTLTNTPTPTPTPTITCYRCTPATDDGNACESQVFNQSSCPVGWTDNSNCFAVEPGGVCPAQTNCYRCTPQVGDGNACELVVINGSTCPAGMSSSPTGCAAAVGGQCDPITPVTCYRCTDTLTDGNTCESFVASNVCPSGSSTDPNGCAAAVGGYCPQYQDSRMMLICYRCTPRLDDGNACESIQFLSDNGLCPSGWGTDSNCSRLVGGICPQNIPNTAIFDDERLNIITLGLIFTLGGLIVYRFRIGSRVVEKPLDILYTGIGNILESVLPFEKKIEKRFRKNRTSQSY